MESVLNNLPLFCTLVGALGVLFAIMLAGIVKKAPAGNERMQEIAGAIQEGAKAYLNRQYMTIGMAGIVLFLVIGFSGIGWATAIGFAIGAILSGAAGYIGMNVSVRANVRTAQAANDGLDAAPARLAPGDTIFQRHLLSLPADLIPLSMAIAPSEGTDALAEMLRVPLSTEGFLKEAQIKLRPMDFMREGIFLAGMAHYPKFVEESISHALAAAARALPLMTRQSLHLGGVVAQVDPDQCVGCLTCTRTCPCSATASGVSVAVDWNCLAC